MAVTKAERRLRIRRHIRNKVAGTSERPRLSVFRSNTGIYAQIIDDTAGRTIVAASSKHVTAGDTPVATAAAVGKELASRAQEKGITQVVFDRSGYLYHGRVKSLAEGAREGGLKF
ncbi:50S ribosomal protein L18 [Hymenobacter busanensis]|uniref:Large ribosomal subunit protein uL18 n=1 Tax=Hymenobacter busanensis TaxID=2607656 RepID=A0A7L5A0X3_9BACT|nr:50S ribosomal protein L18 [Hymenobacter busanensis]KAA9338652.1 50S ribosomal protein L18 [Hymenobacter busanensis]QHJ08917.1 50S ribosomal protein L18 [Hymenobacter busanensis]